MYDERLPSFNHSHSSDSICEGYCGGVVHRYHVEYDAHGAVFDAGDSFHHKLHFMIFHFPS